MNLEKAIEHLYYLSGNEENDLTKYSKANALIAAFKEENERIGVDAHCSEKITDVESYFQSLCGIGEELHFSEEQTQRILHRNISALRMLIDPNDESCLKPCYP